MRNSATVLPSKKASAEAALEQAEVEFDKTKIYAGVTGRAEQFTLQPGDYVNPILRPAGILVPTEAVDSGRQMVQAGFSQLARPVIKVGTCLRRSPASPNPLSSSQWS